MLQIVMKTINLNKRYFICLWLVKIYVSYSCNIVAVIIEEISEFACDVQLAVLTVMGSHYVSEQKFPKSTRLEMYS
jgi:hypothetical protein